MGTRWARALLAVLAMVSLMTGCARQAPTGGDIITETVALYYGDEGNEKMLTETRSVSYPRGADRYQVVLQELVKGPRSEGLRANISPETRVYGTILQEDGDLLVDVSRDFARFSGSIAEIIGVGSVVNTLTQFPEVKRVKILVEGEELIGPSGQPRGFMEPLPNPGEGTVSRDITLYFGNRDATAVVAETRTVSIPADAQLPDLLRIAVEELIKGPRNQDLSPTIPPDTRVLSVSVEEDVAHVDFSREMHTQHWGGAAGESITVQSIVNTLTEFPDIQRVLMTVEGQPLAIEHMVLDQPVGRSEDLAAK